ncbi:hypothetical protein LshimejAT787_0801240 [Lyophyllum shimeji]|uniref:Uncharacterized protein n=1 Tax=Lyophyllum shimeji TaxID=47721 RepID=A0A9P3UP24_LYOSH|nr:hypothetical protein LshimejAT787_0801240 [Lyophyllum shimeji]
MESSKLLCLLHPLTTPLGFLEKFRMMHEDSNGMIHRYVVHVTVTILASQILRFARPFKYSLILCNPGFFPVFTVCRPYIQEDEKEMNFSAAQAHPSSSAVDQTAAVLCHLKKLSKIPLREAPRSVEKWLSNADHLAVFRRSKFILNRHRLRARRLIENVDRQELLILFLFGYASLDSNRDKIAVL